MSIHLHEQREYFSAHFFAGIAVESILRALRLKDGQPFDSSHNIEYWENKVDLMPNQTEAKKEEFRANITQLNVRWRSNQRYYTIKMLDTYLDSSQLDKIRGDRVKYSSGRMVLLLNTIVSLGVIRWNSKY